MRETARNVMKVLFEFSMRYRLVLLGVSALIFSSLVLIISMDMLANKQSMNQMSNYHNEIYRQFLKYVEIRNDERKKEQELEKEQQERHKHARVASVTIDSNPARSPYWLALKDIRRQYPGFRVEILLSQFEGQKNRPKGWLLTEHRNGRLRSVYVLPTRNSAAIEITSTTHDEVGFWRSTTALVAAYALVLFVVLGSFWGLFWGWLLIKTQNPKNTNLDLQNRIGKIIDTVDQMGGIITEMQKAINSALQAPNDKHPSIIHALIVAINQIHLLAVNASIEAARDPEKFKNIMLVMNEINKLSSQSGELVQHLSVHEDKSGDRIRNLEKIKNRLDHLEKSLSSEDTGFSETQTPTGPEPVEPKLIRRAR